MDIQNKPGLSFSVLGVVWIIPWNSCDHSLCDRKVGWFDLLVFPEIGDVAIVVGGHQKNIDADEIGAIIAKTW